MKNCFIPADYLSALADAGVAVKVSSRIIEVDTRTLAELVGVSVSTLKNWTVSGIFGDEVRRVGNGKGRGTYYLYKLDACYRQALKTKEHR